MRNNKFLFYILTTILVLVVCFCSTIVGTYNLNNNYQNNYTKTFSFCNTKNFNKNINITESDPISESFSKTVVSNTISGASSVSKPDTSSAPQPGASSSLKPSASSTSPSGATSSQQQGTSSTSPSALGTLLPLKGIIIGIDPGHQSKQNLSLEQNYPNSKVMKAKVSSGTSGVFTKIPEYKLNLEVGLLLKKKLEVQGATVVMTRNKNDVNISNIERAKITNKANCNMVIRLHANGSEKSTVRGYSILIPGTLHTKSIVPQSKKFAETLDQHLKKNISIESDGIISRNDLTGFNWSTTPVVLLEMGYMSNKQDDKIMSTKEFKTSVVEAISESLIEYYKTNDKKIDIN